MMEHPTTAVPVVETEIHVLDVITLLVRRRMLIVKIVAACCLLVAAIGFMMPHTYISRVSILPPERTERSGLGALLMSSAPSSLEFGGIGENRSSDFYLDVLRSRTLFDSVAMNYPRVKAYFAHETPLEGEQALLFGSVLGIETGRDGLVSIAVQLYTGYFPSAEEQRTTAELSAELAGAVPKMLDRINHTKVMSRARNARMYIGDQLVRLRTQLDSLYDAMTAFQREHKVLAIDKQVESEVKSAADLQTQIMETDYQLRVRTRSQNPNSLEMQQLRDRLTILRDQYGQLQEGADTSAYFLPFPKIPTLQRTYANMLRDLKALEQVYAYLHTQFFQERVQEERDTPTVQVLDNPRVPENRSSPRRALMLIMTFFLSLFGAGAYVLVRESAVAAAASPDGARRWDAFRASFRRPSRSAK
jgi:tyrosine-protein kinase Etk/Wzc